MSMNNTYSSSAAYDTTPLCIVRIEYISISVSNLIKYHYNNNNIALAKATVLQTAARNITSCIQMHTTHTEREEKKKTERKRIQTIITAKN